MGKLNKKGLELKQAFKHQMKQKRKENKELIKTKRAKLIVSNLPFTSTEANIKEHFKKFGEVDAVNILRLPDGKLKGCAFVQFKLVQKAAKAVYHLNNKPFLGRNITVEFAKPKDKYKKEKITKEKEKNENVDLSIVKLESYNEDIKIENKDPIKIENSYEESDSSENGDEENDNDLSEEQEEMNDEDDDNEDNSDELKDKSIIKKPHVVSNDVKEGKTIFVKNVPFDATNKDLKECLSQFGRLYYALICTDPITEHSKGTAFAKFINKEDADKCLEAGTELKLMGNILDCHPALSKDELKRKENEHKKVEKDNRNLYLVKEGVILAGTKAAEGVSATDMAKRLQLEQYKTQILRNLNMYISKYRLVIHNLPATWNDSQLRALVKKHSNSGAVIKEARIMRDRRQVDGQGIGKSKEYGFISFSKHEDALQTLRSLNNNPNVFTNHKRPIVAFSIENKAKVKSKEKRLQLSKLKNPPKNQRKRPREEGEDVQQFTGITAKPGIVKMRSKHNLKTQAQLHHEQMRKEKKERKNRPKSLKERKVQFTKQDKQKINTKDMSQNDNFSKLVNQYKQNLTSSSISKKAKWYE